MNYKTVDNGKIWYQEAVNANRVITAITKAGFFTRLKWLFTGVTTDHEITLESK